MNRELLSLSGLLLGLVVLMAPGCARLHLEEGQAAFDELRYQDAIHHFGSAVQREPNPEAYRKLAAK